MKREGSLSSLSPTLPLNSTVTCRSTTVHTESSPFYSSRFLNPRIGTQNLSITPWRLSTTAQPTGTQYISSPFPLKRTRGGTMPWKQIIHLTCKWKWYNSVKITSFVPLFYRLERLQNFCVNRINDHSDGHFYTQLFTSSSLSVRPYACNVQFKHSTKTYENSLYRKLPTVYSH
jgi:hypothetical protein